MPGLHAAKKSEAKGFHTAGRGLKTHTSIPIIDCQPLQAGDLTTDGLSTQRWNMFWLILFGVIIGGAYFYLREPRQGRDVPDDDDLQFLGDTESEGRDPFDLVEWEETRDFETEATITYQDRNGVVTTRAISIWRLLLGSDGAVLGVSAHCHLRDAPRQFHCVRMQEFTDLATGEIVADPAAYLRARYDETPAGRCERAVKKRQDELCVLLFVARADGRITKNERAVLFDYLKSLEPDLLQDMDLEPFAPMVLGEPLGVAHYNKAIKTLLSTQEPNRIDALAEAVTAVARTRKSESPLVTGALENTLKKLGHPHTV